MIVFVLGKQGFNLIFIYPQPAVFTIMSAEKLQELNRLIQLYETAIERHETLLRKVLRGKDLSAQVSKEKYIALVKGDLRLMRDKKSELEDEVRELEIKAIQDSIEDEDPNLLSSVEDSEIVV